MGRFSFWRVTLTLSIFVCSVAPTPQAKHKELPAVRWTENAPGCTFERGDDGRYRWTIAARDLTLTILVDSQELTKSRRRFYHLIGMYVSAKYTGTEKLEFPADVRIDFLRHHDVMEGYEDPTELSNKLQNAIDTVIFDTERQIKKDPKIADEKTASLREYQKDAAEFIEFLSTQTLRPTPATLTPGNPEDAGWVFFATSNKWIGLLKEHEDFIVSFWMKDKTWQFPVSLPPTPGDLILRKPQD
jgi:hypothetical protein